MPSAPETTNPVEYLLESHRACPQCGQPLDRMRRRAIDRVTSLFVPVQRYRCRAFTCRWEGNLKAMPTATNTPTRT